MSDARTRKKRPSPCPTSKQGPGVTGHNVRYVLAFGLLGSLIAFAVIVLYFGHEALGRMISETWSGLNASLIVSYAVLIALAVAAVVLLVGLWDMVAGRSSNASQKVMRWRVVLQLIVICLVMAGLFLSAKY
jgi:hypothetical protein